MAITGSFSSKLANATLQWLPLIRSIAPNNETAARMLAIVDVESRGNANARGAAGELGLGQVLPDTARTVGFTGDLLDPQNNLAVVRLLLDRIEGQVGGDLSEIFSAYNCGWHSHAGGTYSACRLHPPEGNSYQNQDYINGAMLALKEARSLLRGGLPAPDPGPEPGAPSDRVRVDVPQYVYIALMLIVGATVIQLIED